jgi:hypothetical protein
MHRTNLKLVAVVLVMFTCQPVIGAQENSKSNQLTNLGRATAFAVQLEIRANRLENRTDVCVGLSEKLGVSEQAILAELSREKLKVRSDHWCNQEPRGLSVSVISVVRKSDSSTYEVRVELGDYWPISQRGAHFGTLLRSGTYTVNCREGAEPMLIRYQTIMPPEEGQKKSEQSPGLCGIECLPSDIRNRLKENFGSWKIQEASDLDTRSHERWEAEKPLECPGIAIGQFKNTGMPSYAVLLVTQGHADVGYKFVIFGPEAGPSYEMRVVDSGDSGASHFFIHGVQIAQFFDEQARKKFHIHTSEGVLLVDSAEKEYEVDLYFWMDGAYQHQPLDY